MDNLVQVYNNALPQDMCSYIIDTFESSSDNTMEGMSGGGVQRHIKASTDLMIHQNLDDKRWKYIYDYLMSNLLTHWVDYLSKNPFVVRGDGFSSKSSLVRSATHCFMSGNNNYPHIQMQRYIGGEGYYAWHHENEGGTSAKREVFYIYYLNTLEEGATEFKYNPQKVYPEAGKLIMAPCHWTHKHRGNPPGDGNTKYILTGWLESKPHNIHEEFEQDYLL